MYVQKFIIVVQLQMKMKKQTLENWLLTSVKSIVKDNLSGNVYILEINYVTVEPNISQLMLLVL